MRIWLEKPLFKGCFWFNFNNLGLAYLVAFKFYTSVVKGWKLIFRKFWELVPTFVDVIVCFMSWYAKLHQITVSSCFSWWLHKPDDPAALPFFHLTDWLSSHVFVKSSTSLTYLTKWKFLTHLNLVLKCFSWLFQTIFSSSLLTCNTSSSVLIHCSAIISWLFLIVLFAILKKSQIRFLIIPWHSLSMFILFCFTFGQIYSPPSHSYFFSILVFSCFHSFHSSMCSHTLLLTSSFHQHIFLCLTGPFFHP